LRKRDRRHEAEARAAASHCVSADQITRRRFHRHAPIHTAATYPQQPSPRRRRAWRR
jgi:hypothetical protein